MKTILFIRTEKLLRHQKYCSIIFVFIINLSVYSQDVDLLKSLDITYSLYNNIEGITIEDDLKLIELRTTIYKVKQDEKLEAIIEKNGILFDGESLTLLYILNPKLDAINWESFNDLVIPVLNKNYEYLKSDDKQLFISIICYSTLKKGITSKIDTLNIKLDKIVQNQKLNKINDYKLFEDIKEISEIISRLIQSRTKPLNKEFLENILAEIEELSKFETSFSDLTLLDNDKKEELSSIKESLELIAHTGVFKRNSNDTYDQFPKVNVLVTILDNKKINEKLKVYYVPRARLNKKEIYYEEFDKFSPPTVDKLITVGSYWFWAGRPNNLEALTNMQKVSVTFDKEQIEIELITVEK